MTRQLPRGLSERTPPANDNASTVAPSTAMPPMRIGSLFSGIGGLELGLEMAGLGACVWQVESDAFCRQVLEKHWPEVTRYEDVRGLRGAALSAVDLICGGFPCQDVSSAGKRAGLGGARSGLWFEFLRLVQEIRPHWVVVENVASGARAWVDDVTRGLELEGYACVPVPLAAADVGAPHERARVFIVAAHADAQSQSLVAVHAEVAGAPAPAPHAHGDELRIQRLVARSRGGHRGAEAAELADHRWREPEPPMVRVVHGVSARLDASRARARVAALGNAVVPQCAEVIGHMILQLRA